MYRKNLDILIAGAAGLLGGVAYMVHAPGPVQVILGVALFFAPGYLWSEAILSQRLSGLERVLTSAGISLILPIIGGFLFYGLRIPLFRSAWVGLLVVLTLAGVIAVAIQRLAEGPVAQRQAAPEQPAKKSGLPLVHLLVYGLAAVVALGTVAFSVKSAAAQKYPGTTALSMSEVLTNPGLVNPVQHNPPVANPVQNNGNQANLVVTNNQGVAEQYELKLLRNKKVVSTWNITLSDGQTWQKVIAYSTAQNKPISIVADLYLLPDTSKPYRYVDNGE